MVKKIFIGLALAASVVWAWNWLESDGQKIKNELKSLAASLSYEKAPQGLEVMGKARKIANHFAAQVKVTLEFSHRQSVELVSQSEILEKSIFVFKAIPKMKVEFVDVNVRSIDGPTAKVEATMKVQLGTDSNQMEAIEVHLDLRKDRRWIIDGLKTVEAINL